MSLQLYMDEQVPIAITRGLRRRSVDVITVQEDGFSQKSDLEVLERAAGLQRVIFTQDRHFLAEAAKRQKSRLSFCGVIYGHQRKVSIGQGIADLELIAKVYDLSDLMNLIVYLPLI